MKSILTLVLLMGAATLAHADDVNHEQLIFPAANGQVVFMHTDHQVAEKACRVCHPTEKPGKIPGFGKELAHKLCVDCHQVKGGPTDCNTCHEK